jgi:hypothetical protein
LNIFTNFKNILIVDDVHRQDDAKDMLKMPTW